MLQIASQFEIKSLNVGIKNAQGCTLKRSFQLSSSSTCQSSRRAATRWKVEHNIVYEIALQGRGEGGGAQGGVAPPTMQ